MASELASFSIFAPFTKSHISSANFSLSTEHPVRFPCGSGATRIPLTDSISERLN